MPHGHGPNANSCRHVSIEQEITFTQHLPKCADYFLSPSRLIGLYSVLLCPLHFTNTDDPSYNMHTQVFLLPPLSSLSSMAMCGWAGLLRCQGEEGEEGLMYICMREGAKKSDARNQHYACNAPISLRENLSSP